MGWGSVLRGMKTISREVAQNQRHIDGLLKVINESLNICRSSKNPETRISRMGVTIERLQNLCDEHPGWPDIKNWLTQKAQLEQEYCNFVMNNLSEMIDEDATKIDNMKSESARYNRAKKLIEKLQPYKQHRACDSQWVSRQILQLKQTYNVTEDIVEQQATYQTSENRQQTVATPSASTVPVFKPVTLLGKFGIWFCWAGAFSPISQRGESYAAIGFIGSIALTVVTVKWLNRRRMQKAGIAS